MLRLSLIRHGQTAWNAEGRFLGWTDVPLDATGHAQAEARAASLPRFDRVYSSSSARASQTAACFGEPVLLDALRELDQGELEGRKAAAMVERYPDFFRAWATDPTDLVVPGGSESFGRARERALDALCTLADAAADELGADARVAVVSHQLIIASVQCAVEGVPLARWRSYRLENLGVVELVRDPDAACGFRRP